MKFGIRVSMHQRYFGLCLRQVDAYKAELAEFGRLENMPVGEEELHIAELNIAVQYEAVEQAVVAPIVSAAMCLEAFSFDYAASNLGDDYVENHMEKLGVPSRIVVATRLITGTGLDTRSAAYQDMVGLLRTRNRVVHFKSRVFDATQMDDAVKFRRKLNEEIAPTALKAPQVIRAVLAAIDSLHGSGSSYACSVEPTACHA